MGRNICGKEWWTIPNNEKTLAVKLQTCMTNEVVYYLSKIKDDVWILLLLNFDYERNANPITLFKAKWEIVLVKLASLLKRNFPFKSFFNKFLRSRLRVASCERLYNKVSLSKINNEFNDTCRYAQNSCFPRCFTN